MPTVLTVGIGAMVWIAGGVEGRFQGEVVVFPVATSGGHCQEDLGVLVGAVQVTSLRLLVPGGGTSGNIFGKMGVAEGQAPGA